MAERSGVWHCSDVRHGWRRAGELEKWNGSSERRERGGVRGKGGQQGDVAWQYDL